jgi:hypothetical protein
MGGPSAPVAGEDEGGPPRHRAACLALAARGQRQRLFAKAARLQVCLWGVLTDCYADDSDLAVAAPLREWARLVSEVRSTSLPQCFGGEAAVTELIQLLPCNRRRLFTLLSLLMPLSDSWQRRLADFLPTPAWLPTAVLCWAHDTVVDDRRVEMAQERMTLYTAVEEACHVELRDVEAAVGAGARAAALRVLLGALHAVATVDATVEALRNAASAVGTLINTDGWSKAEEAALHRTALGWHYEVLQLVLQEGQ